jgi:hypothetical protein
MYRLFIDDGADGADARGFLRPAFSEFGCSRGAARVMRATLHIATCSAAD